MSYIKQPRLFQQIPINVYIDVADWMPLNYHTVVNDSVYDWTQRVGPSGEVVWIPSSRSQFNELRHVTLVAYKDIPPELYQAIKLFYVGKLQPVTRG